MQHTEAPWYMEVDHGTMNFAIYAQQPSGMPLALLPFRTGMLGVNQGANAIRIVACVNKLAGWSMEDLKNKEIADA